MRQDEHPPQCPALFSAHPPPPFYNPPKGAGSAGFQKGGRAEPPPPFYNPPKGAGSAGFQKGGRAEPPPPFYNPPKGARRGR